METCLHHMRLASYRIRSMFYLLTPNETYYETEQDVPDLTLDSMNMFFTLMFVEQIVFYLRYGRFSGKVNDHVNNNSDFFCYVFVVI